VGIRHTGFSVSQKYQLHVASLPFVLALTTFQASPCGGARPSRHSAADRSMLVVSMPSSPGSPKAPGAEIPPGSEAGSEGCCRGPKLMEKTMRLWCGGRRVDGGSAGVSVGAASGTLHASMLPVAARTTFDAADALHQCS